MKKFSNAILMTLAIALLVSVPACRSRRNVPPPVTNTGAATTTVPDVPDVPPTDTTQRVVEEPDFVTPEPTEDIVPSNIEELNRWAQTRGHIRDAFYNYDEATLDDAAQAALTSSANWLKGEGRAYNLLVEGHCDERGTEQYNLALGDRRANSARDYLMTLGVDGSRIRTVSYGEERPFEEGHDESSFAQNRRAHLVLVRPGR
jgi:peptidoglycan-associated lipoprotein